nr:MAG TPA: hypothetical protein [Caudoviricetes sp.]
MFFLLSLFFCSTLFNCYVTFQNFDSSSFSLLYFSSTSSML